MGSWWQAADVLVTQAVEHQGDQFPGRGDDADVAAAARAELVTDPAEGGNFWCKQVQGRSERQLTP